MFRRLDGHRRDRARRIIAPLPPRTSVQLVEGCERCERGAVAVGNWEAVVSAQARSCAAFRSGSSKSARSSGWSSEIEEGFQRMRGHWARRATRDS